MWNAYIAALHRRPVSVKACTSCITFSITDCIAQGRQRHHQRQQPSCLPVQQHDFAQTALNGLFGLLWLGPLNHIVWGRTIFGLEHWFPGPSWRAVFSRVAVDQVTNMPLNMVAFLAWPHLLRGDLSGARASIGQSFWPSYFFALSIWPFVHPLSFRYVPLEHRLLVLNVCSVGVFSWATWVRELEQHADPGFGGAPLRRRSSTAAVAAAG